MGNPLTSRRASPEIFGTSSHAARILNASTDSASAGVPVLGSKSLRSRVVPDAQQLHDAMQSNSVPENRQAGSIDPVEGMDRMVNARFGPPANSAPNMATLNQHSDPSPAMDTLRSPSLRRGTLPTSSLLTPSELESLKSEMQESVREMRKMLDQRNP
jgi:hypothetical protein